MTGSLLILACLLLTSGRQPPEKVTPAGPTEVEPELKTIIERHLGRPYVWGASGLKSFDCSGFVWRVMTDSGILIKRTTARKFYVSLPKVSESERSQFGTVVFFANLKHCGIVNDRLTFYHSQTSKGTNLSKMDSFWKPKVCGYRAMPGKPVAAPQ